MLTAEAGKKQLFSLLETGGGVITPAQWLGIVAQLESEKAMDSVYSEGLRWRASRRLTPREFVVGEEAE